MSSEPNTGIPYVTEGTLDPAAGLNLAINWIGGLLQTEVISMALTAPPGGEQDGDLYIVGASPTGAWAGRANDLARFVAEGAFWQFFDAGAQVRLVLNRADQGLYQFNDLDSPVKWQRVTAPVVLTIPVGDLTTAITAGTTKAYLRAPFAFTLEAVRASLLTGSASGDVTIDVNEAGVSVLSTKLSIDATEKTSTTAAVPAVISDANIADDAELEIDIDAAGTTAAGLIVTLIGRRAA